MTIPQISNDNDCPKKCWICEDMDHHWMLDFTDDEEAVMACKHCPAQREMTDEDEF